MRTAVAKIRSASRLRPTLALGLGSGFQALTRELTDVVRLPFSQLPGFTRARVPGHAGELLIGRLAATTVIVLSSRAHYYEGRSLQEVTFPIRTLASYGICDLLLTNAAGAIKRGFQTGEFMQFSDHINFRGDNPPRGVSPAEGKCFVDLTDTYDNGLNLCLTRAARTTRLRLHRGVHLAVSGPSYETPAEIRTFARLGADAVGMSTVPEAIVARQAGLRVAAVSCLTNLAAGRGVDLLSHQEVLDNAARCSRNARRLLTEFARNYARSRSVAISPRSPPIA